VPGSPSSASEYAARNDKYANGKLVIETEEQVMAKAPNPSYSGSIDGFLSFNALSAQDQQDKGTAGTALSARAANGSYDSGTWQQIWLFTGVAATQDITHTFLVKTTTGTGEDAEEAYGTFSLTVRQGQKASTEGSVDGDIPGVSISGGVASIQPAVPGGNGDVVRIDVLPVEVKQPTVNADGTVGALAQVSELRMSRWNSPRAANHQVDRAAFAALDPDRIVIRLPVPSKKGSASVKVKVSTRTGTYTPDAGAELDFKAESAGSEYFVSDSLAIVTDEEDDDLQVGTGEDNELGDRTFRARPGGKLHIECSDMGSQAIEIPIKKFTHKIRYQNVSLEWMPQKKRQLKIASMKTICAFGRFTLESMLRLLRRQHHKQ
jgi:hypothetical protein